MINLIGFQKKDIKWSVYLNCKIIHNDNIIRKLDKILFGTSLCIIFGTYPSYHLRMFMLMILLQKCIFICLCSTWFMLHDLAKLILSLSYPGLYASWSCKLIYLVFVVPGIYSIRFCYRKVLAYSNMFSLCVVLRNTSHRKLLEYLFWVWNPEVAGGLTEPSRVLEAGFHDADTYKVLR